MPPERDRMPDPDPDLRALADRIAAHPDQRRAPLRHELRCARPRWVVGTVVVSGATGVALVLWHLRDAGGPLGILGGLGSLPLIGLLAVAALAGRLLRRRPRVVVGDAGIELGGVAAKDAWHHPWTQITRVGWHPTGAGAWQLVLGLRGGDARAALRAPDDDAEELRRVLVAACGRHGVPLDAG